MGRVGPETRLLRRMREAGMDKYGSRLVIVKYHGSAYSEAGVSDLLCVLDGVFLAIEVKAPETYGGSVEAALGRGVTVKQQAFLDRVNAAGGIGRACASVDSFLETLAEAEQKGMM